MRIITVDENGYPIDIDEKEKETRLIDASLIIDNLNHEIEIAENENYFNSEQIKLKAAILKMMRVYINKQPTVDVVPVVRCDKCRWHYEQGRDIICSIIKDIVSGDVYCLHWERKTDETN